MFGKTALRLGFALLLPLHAMAGRELLTDKGLAAFQSAYLPKGGHRAFAVSEHGAWGWTANRETQEAARHGARENCTKHVKAGELPCEVVHEGDAWLPDPVMAALPPDDPRACATVDACIGAAMRATAANHRTGMFAALGRLMSFRKPPAIDVRRGRELGAPGIKALHRGDLGTVEELLGKAARLDPSNEDYQLTLALALMAQGRIEQAGPALAAALAVAPYRHNAWLAQALALNRQGKPDEARMALQVAHAWAPDKAAVLQSFRDHGGGTDALADVYRKAVAAIEAPPPTPAAAPLLPAPLEARLRQRMCGAPDYPKSAVMRGLTGTTILKFQVGADGKVLDALVEKSSGHTDLDGAALISIGSCPKFKGEGWTRVAYEWRMD